MYIYALKIVTKNPFQNLKTEYCAETFSTILDVELASMEFYSGEYNSFYAVDKDGNETLLSFAPGRHCRRYGNTGKYKAVAYNPLLPLEEQVKYKQKYSKICSGAHNSHVPDEVSYHLTFKNGGDMKVDKNIWNSLNVKWYDSWRS